jgi:hypothetical protein
VIGRNSRRRVVAMKDGSESLLTTRFSVDGLVAGQKVALIGKEVMFVLRVRLVFAKA